MAPANSPFSSADTLFMVVAAQPLSTEQRHFLSLVQARPTSAEVHVARLTETPATLLQVDRAIVLNVSPSRSFSAVGTRVETAPDYVGWSGTIGGVHGSVGLVLTSKGVTGSLTSVPTVGASAVYRFEPIGGGLQAIVCVDVSKFPPDD